MASIPEDCTVLVVGGGPGGSYTASVLAREGVDTVLLEADVFPRYHIGESMLASFRHFLRFIDLDSTFVQHGFTKKVGAAFKLNGKREGFTDFVASGGPENYAWNVIRSESDELMFRHAGKSGAKIFDGVKVSEVNFQPPDNKTGPTNLGRPISASWQHKDGSTGVVKFRYLVDASGRAGLICNKYLKNRKFNQGLKNVASWGYWKGNSQYAAGTARENSPFFESLRDGSGWCWAIPLHNGTMSVGIVMNQALSISKKKAMESPSPTDFYKESLKLVPDVLELLKNAELITDIKSASDWSYSASCYASPYVRIVGDAGCFIDPYFSSGVHLALSSALSAAVTICAAERGQCTEVAAGDWHSKKVKEGYTRFLLVVLSALKQIMERDEPVLSDWDEDGFDRAFAFFRPIIQGTSDVNTKLTQDEVSKTVDFCLNAFSDKVPDDQVSVMRKVGLIADTSKTTTGNVNGNGTSRDAVTLETLTPDELLLLKNIRARQMLRMEDRLHIDNFAKDSIDGFVPHLEKGNLGLVSPVG